jgi:hypothetical protein
MVRINSSHSQPGEMPKLPCKVATIIMNIADIYVHIMPYMVLLFVLPLPPSCAVQGRGVTGSEGN